MTTLEDKGKHTDDTQQGRTECTGQETVEKKMPLPTKLKGK